MTGFFSVGYVIYVVFLVCEKNHTHIGNGSTLMGIITQDITNVQEVLETVLPIVPTVLTKDTHFYVLLKDLNDELQKFINTEKAGANEIDVFTAEYENELVFTWQKNGYEYKSQNQTVEYFHRRVSVRYLTVNNPRTNISVSLIPWFILPGRPYPVFVYAYAEWHYGKSEQKSMRLSARAAGKVFGVESFNKSTLSRIHNNKHIFNLNIDRAQDAGEQSSLPDANTAEFVVELLENNLKTQKHAAPDEGGQCSPKISNSEYISHIFYSVPDELSKVIKGRPLPRQATKDTRKRPPRRLAAQQKRMQRPPDFVNSSQIEHIRISFIAACKAAVLDTAIKYQKFLINY